jgi:hypothetical protein
METKNGENGGRGGGFPDAPEVKGQRSKVDLSKTFNIQRSTSNVEWAARKAELRTGGKTGQPRSR